MTDKQSGTEFIGSTYMSLDDVSNILFEPKLQNALLKSARPQDVLTYLNTVLKYHEVRENAKH